MKKLVLLTLAATVVAGSAFAAAPVTKISDGSTKVQADYAFKQHVSKGGGHSNDGFGVSLQHDLSDKTAVQYSYDKVNAKMVISKIINSISLQSASKRKHLWLQVLQFVRMTLNWASKLVLSGHVP